MKTNINNIIQERFENFGMSLTQKQIDNLSTYANLLIEWNNKINLTAITDPEGIVVKHFLDSAALLKYVDIKENSSIIDVGTGAGFPGVVLKILREDINLTLLDSLKKRLTFLEELLKSLNLNASLIHARAEDGAKKIDLREKFDVVTSRAVARMNVLCEYCLGYAKINGYFCPLKGPSLEDEMADAENCINIMGGKVESIKKFSLENEGTRTIVVIKKIRKTPTKYPRSNKQISAKALR